ncbi:MAG: O-antigen ligase family protein [Peptococcaceae bacterium]|nr:O-antigen ligase family protein [Peptococcaceae bacterium]
MINREKPVINCKLTHPIIWFMLALYPLIIVPNEYNYSCLPRYIILLTLGLLAGFCLVRDRYCFPRHRSLIPLIVFLILSLIAAILSSHPAEALLGTPFRFTGFLTHLVCAVLFILAYLSVRNHADINRFINIFLGTAAIVAFLGLLQFFGIQPVPHPPGFDFGLRSDATIGNPNFLGTYIVLAFPFAAVKYLQKPCNKWALLVALIYAVGLTNLTRGVWIGLFAAFLVLFFYLRNRRSLFSFIAILITVTAVLFPLHDGLLYKRVFSLPAEAQSCIEGDDNAGTNRLYIWKITAAQLKNTLLIGTGPDTLKYALEDYRDRTREVFGREIIIDKAHNIYLEQAVTHGLLALICYLTFLFCLLRPERKDALSVAFLSMVVGYMVQGTFNIDVVQVYPLWWIMLGFYLAHSSSKAAKNSQ